MSNINVPDIKVVSISNVFCRLMHFSKKGDVEIGHKHYYDHGTLVSSGSVLVEELNDEGSVNTSNTFVGPTFIFIKKEFIHRITALEDNTVCVCIHALRTIDQDIVSPEFLINPHFDVDESGVRDLIYQKELKPMQPLVEWSPRQF